MIEKPFDCTTLNLYQKWHGIMGDWATVSKGKKMVQGQYAYVSHDAVSSALHEHLVKWRVVCRPTVLSMVSNGDRTEVVLETSLINIDKPDEVISVTSCGYGVDKLDKGPGKSVSYAFKYAILKLFCLETTDDPDHDQSGTHTPGPVTTVGHKPVSGGAPQFQSQTPNGFPQFGGKS